MRRTFFKICLAAALIFQTDFTTEIHAIGPSHHQKNKIPNESDYNPDYSNLINWASHPKKHDPADSIPAFLQCGNMDSCLYNEIRDSNVDVFFLHPTTYTKGFYGWNARMDDEAVNKKTDEGTMLYQASVFNGSCRVFAPRYRQAYLKAFFTKDTAQASQALDFAYNDLRSAFQYYLEHWNHGRPIIIASHSQGTRHAIRLLEEFFDGKPLQKQLVCAYLVGYRISKKAFKTIPLGTNPSMTGCVMGWRTFKKGFAPAYSKSEKGDCLIVNPVTWTVNPGWSPNSLHKGLIARNFNKLLYPHELSAEIAPDVNVLWVDLPRKLKRQLGFINNFHIADYNFFYLNMRENIKERVRAYLNK